MVYYRCSLCTCIIRRKKTHAGESELWNLIKEYCQIHILEPLERTDLICGICDSKFRNCIMEGNGRVPEEITIVSSSNTHITFFIFKSWCNLFVVLYFLLSIIIICSIFKFQFWSFASNTHILYYCLRRCLKLIGMSSSSVRQFASDLRLHVFLT